MPNDMITSSSLIIALLASLCVPAVAQEIGDIAAGRRLAENWCSSCHVVDASSRQGVSSGAPTFSAIARMKSTTPMAIASFLTDTAQSNARSAHELVKRSTISRPTS